MHCPGTQQAIVIIYLIKASMCALSWNIAGYCHYIFDHGRCVSWNIADYCHYIFDQGLHVFTVLEHSRLLSLHI